MKHWVLMAALAASGDAEFGRYAEHIVDAASSSRDARVLMAAASFGQSSPAIAAKSDALYSRALQLGADDPVVWWIAATECPASKVLCDRAAAARRLRELAPNNAAGWLLDAGEGHDAGLRIERAAAAVRFDQYDSEHVQALLEAQALVSAPAALVEEAARTGRDTAVQRVRVSLALGKWLAHSLPSYAGINAVCREEDAGAALRDSCEALGYLMLEHSNNVLAQRIGSANLLAWLPPGPARDEVVEARRRMDWQQAAFMEIDTREDFPAPLLHWLQPNANELTVMRDTLLAAGIALDPPPGWRSDREPVLPGPEPGSR